MKKLMKSYNLLFIVFAFILTPIHSFASAEKVEIDGIMYNLNNDNTAEVTYYGDNYLFLQNKYSGFIEVPNSIEYNGVMYKVKSISEGAFYYCNNISGVSIPNSITSIGDFAFSGCNNMKNMTIPSTVISIGSHVFSGCTNLLSCSMDEGLKSIGESAFSYCNNLNTIVLPASVEEIGESIFEGCKNIETINLSDKITKICSYTFKGCDKLQYLTLPKDLNSIGDGAFENCVALKEVTIPNNVQTIGNSAFKGDEALTIIVNSKVLFEIGDNAFDDCKNIDINFLPESVRSIGKSAFRNCKSLSSMIIPEGIISLKEGVFKGCVSLTSVFFPSSLELIGDSTFKGCVGLAEIVLPSNLKQIGDSAFSGCKLESVMAMNPNVIAAKAFSKRTLSHTLLYIPIGKWADAVYNGDWYLFSNIKEVALSRSDLSSNRAYTLMRNDNFSYMVCNAETQNISSVSAFYSLDEDSPYHSWQVLEKGGTHYLYNIGVKKFASVYSDGTFKMHDEEIPIHISDNEIGMRLGDYSDISWSFVPNKRLNISKSSSVDSPKVINNSNSSYLISGIKHGNVYKGINIKRCSDGKIRKVIVK